MVRERAERAGEAQASPTRHTMSVAEIRQLIALMDSTDLEELVIEQEATGLRLVLRKPPLTSAPALEPMPAEPSEPMESVEPLESVELDLAGTDAPAARRIEVRAPLVGIFRASLDPAGPPAAAEGDEVDEGQVIGAIEALNVLNEVESPAPGHVKDVLVSDGQAVEYGQPLLTIAANGL
jgi:acetyl-CoA carboxylase biotin carboxyl carrier protein